MVPGRPYIHSEVIVGMFQAIRQKLPISRIEKACIYKLVPIMGNDIIEQLVPFNLRRDSPSFWANIFMKITAKIKHFAINISAIITFILDILVIGIGITLFCILLEAQIFRHPPLGTNLYNLVLVSIAFIYNGIKDYFGRILRGIFYAADKRMFRLELIVTSPSRFGYAICRIVFRARQLKGIREVIKISSENRTRV